MMSAPFSAKFSSSQGTDGRNPHFCLNTIANRPTIWPTVAPPNQFRKVSLKWKPHNWKP